MIKAIILIGGPQKGTRFRPLSLEVPKPLISVAGSPLLYHHIEALAQVPGMKEIIVIGSYHQDLLWRQFLTKANRDFGIHIRFLTEFAPLGTAGGLHHFRDQIMAGKPDHIFVLNSDVCGDFPLKRMLEFHQQRQTDECYTILGTEATPEQSVNFGCIVEKKDNSEVLHYVEKPETFVSTTISCGIYLFSPGIFQHLTQAFTRNQEKNLSADPGEPVDERISLERDVLTRLSDSRCFFVCHTQAFWSQIKTAGALIYANRHYLELYRARHPERLAQASEGGPTIVGDVYIDPSASVHPSAKLGPNAVIGKHAVIGEGVRVRESVVMEEATVKGNSCILYTILGGGSLAGMWSRLEGSAEDPNPNAPFAKIEARDLFDSDGRMNPTISVIGHRVVVDDGVLVRNAIIMPDKEVDDDVHNRIII